MEIIKSLFEGKLTDIGLKIRKLYRLAKVITKRQANLNNDKQQYIYIFDVGINFKQQTTIKARTATELIFFKS